MTLKDALDQTVPQKAAFSEIGEKKFIGAEYNMVRLVVWSCSKIISNELVNLIACLYTSHYQSFELTVGLSPCSQPKCLKYFATPVMRVYVRNFHPIGWSRLSTDKTRSFLVNPAQLTFPSISVRLISRRKLHHVYSPLWMKKIQSLVNSKIFSCTACAAWIHRLEMRTEVGMNNYNNKQTIHELMVYRQLCLSHQPTPSSDCINRYTMPCYTQQQHVLIVVSLFKLTHLVTKNDNSQVLWK